MILNWPISGVSGEDKFDAHVASMREAGWLPVAELLQASRGRRRMIAQPSSGDPRAQIGSRVLVSLDNGYETWGFVVKVFKNGARRIRNEADGKTNNRASFLLWVRA